jgi:hypothetical protein
MNTAAGFYTRQDQENFLFTTDSRSAVGVTQPPTQKFREHFALG